MLVHVLDQSCIYSVTIAQRLLVQVWEKLWSIIDDEQTGFVDYGKFMRYLFGEMSEQRKVFVRKAFSRLDPSKRGVGEVSDIKKYFLPSKHPKVIKGMAFIVNIHMSLFRHLILKFGQIWTNF